MFLLGDKDHTSYVVIFSPVLIINSCVTTTPQLSGKKPPFPYPHGFCGSRIWKGDSRVSSSLSHNGLRLSSVTQTMGGVTWGLQLLGLGNPPPRWLHHSHDRCLVWNGWESSSAGTIHTKSYLCLLQYASVRQVCLLTWVFTVPKVSVLENKMECFGLLWPSLRSQVVLLCPATLVTATPSPPRFI